MKDGLKIQTGIQILIVIVQSKSFMVFKGVCMNPLFTGVLFMVKFGQRRK
jgi:hypothetical protein